MKGRITIQIALCILFILVGQSIGMPQLNLQSKMMLAFDEVVPEVVFRQLAGSLKYEVSLDEKPARPITIWARNVTMQTALDAICEDIGCRWHIEGGKLLIESSTETEPSGLRSRSTNLKKGLDSRLSSPLRFENVPLPSALKEVFGFARVGYVLFGEVLSESRLVTADVSNERVADALTIILKNAAMDGFQVLQTLEDPPAYFILVSAKR